MKRATIISTVLAIAMITLAGCYPAVLTGDPDSLQGFLAILLTAGGIGAAVAFIFEKVPYVDEWFAALDSKAKRLVILASSFVVPSVALGAAVGLGYYEFTPDLVYLALRAGFEAFTASQVAHMVVLK